MKTLKPVRWKEGMFLRPHHFQQFDLYLESRETARLRALETHAWGLMRLELRKESLDNFSFQVTELEAVLPDGTYIDVPDNSQLPVRSFEDRLTEPGRPVTVSLGVRAREERRSQVKQGDAGQAVTRFSSIERNVYDVDAGEGSAPIELLEYDLKLLLGEESQQGFDVMPLTQVVGTGDPVRPVSIVKTFAAPSLSLRGSPALLESATAVLEHISKVQRDLAGRRTGDVDTAVLYSVISGCKAVLRDMVQDGRVHPQRVYHELARLAGGLYYRDLQGGSSDDLPAYDHRAPGPVFEQLRDVIRRLGDKTVTRLYQRFEMPGAAGNFSLNPLPELVRENSTRCYLEIEADASQPHLRQMMVAAVVSCAAQIETLKSGALVGVPTEPMPGPPPEILHERPTASYFRLKQENPEWSSKVIASGDLAVYLREAQADVKLNLIAVPPIG